MNDTAAPYVQLIKAQGYRVFMRPGCDTYCLYTDDVRIGYAQWNRYRLGVSSVHKPSRQVGTGFHVADTITPETIREALHCFAPSWAYQCDRQQVKKYSDFNEYLRESKFNSELTEV